VTALTLLTCKFYQFRSLHNLRSLVSGSSYPAQPPAMSTALTCGMAWGSSFLSVCRSRPYTLRAVAGQRDKEKKCDSSNYG
jgi:hypothetical protein